MDEPLHSIVNLHVGFRRLKVQPLYSEDSTGQDKHRYVKVFSDCTAVASIYFQ
jgi:hypothetical protein